MTTATSNRPNTDAADGRPQAVTLVMGNNLLRDVREDKSSLGNPILIRRKPGSILADTGR